MTENFQWGWIANELQAKSARFQGFESDVDKLHQRVAPWDATQQPTLVTYPGYSAYLSDLAKEADAKRAAGMLKNWWETPAYQDGLLIDSQGGAPSCAGVSYFDRCYLTTLINQKSAGSEQTIERVNAMASWLISKGGNRTGGQTVAAVVDCGATLGVYPARLTGDYDAAGIYNPQWREYDSEARQRQMGACLLEDENGDSMNANDLTEAILLACRAGKAVEIGQSIAVRAGRTLDDNGVQVVKLGGIWAHATAFCGWKQVNGAQYAYWINSHGRIYESSDGSPALGGWMEQDTVRSFCSSVFCDAAIVTYVESPHGADDLNLNHYGINGVIL